MWQLNNNYKHMKTLEELEKKMCTPSADLVRDISKLDGDIIILGVGGKMGPSLAKLAVNAIKIAGIQKRVIGVSRFSEEGMKADLENAGVETVSADLLDESDLHSLPDAKNVLYMAGKKFGTKGNEHVTWAMNSYLPGQVGEKFRNSRIVVFSSGNIYPYMEVGSGGATESTPAGPVGEYAMSCLGRERIFQYISDKHKIPLLIYRLNYAIDLQYGNLMEIAKMVYEKKPIDLTNGYMNVIWQGDANEIAIRSLLHCEMPAKILNVTGPETISIRKVAETFGKLFDITPQFENTEAQNALLNNASLCHRLFGYPKVTLNEMIEMTHSWVINQGKTHNKPTHFQERSGNY
jgi:nucleoside-diphosphate-sugar epimerase